MEIYTAPILVGEGWQEVLICKAEKPVEFDNLTTHIQHCKDRGRFPPRRGRGGCHRPLPAPQKRAAGVPGPIPPPACSTQRSPHAGTPGIGDMLWPPSQLPAHFTKEE